MTRINVIPVSCLSIKHLQAEYHEITRPFNKVIRRIHNGTMDNVIIPDRYCLGEGHETFFFDKLKWLYNRYGQLFEELIRRGRVPDMDKWSKIRSSIYRELGDTVYWNGYDPDHEDMYLNMARLCKRSLLHSVLKEINDHE